MDASFPITLLRDLPVQSGSVDPHGVHVVAVVDGRYARRVPLDSVQDVFVSRDANVPSSYDSPSNGDMAWDSTGLYVHTDAGWGKTMLYCSNWPDLTPTTRFLRVDAVMSLSGTEVGNALSSLGIGDATDSLRGLVRLAGSMLDGAAVPTAATVAAYVAGELQGVRDDVAAVEVMRDEVAGMLQDVGSLESSVRSMRDDVVEASSEVHADMSRAETAASGATASAQAAREAMEAAEAAADRAEAAVEFDEVATQGSRKAVRSGGLYDEFAGVRASVQDVDCALDAHAGDSVVHITQEERERWNAGGGGGGLTPEQQTVLDRLVGGAVAGEFSVWSAAGPPSSATIRSYIGSSGTALDLSADSVYIASCTGVSVGGGLEVDGSPVLTRAMLGAFPGDGVYERDGVATVSDARAYITRSISESAGTVLANYVPLHGSSRITGNLSLDGRLLASAGLFGSCLCLSGGGIGMAASPPPYQFREPRLHRRANDLYWGSCRLNGQSAGGDVTADGDNYFTGDNTFKEPLTLESNALQSSAALYNHGGHLYWGSCRLDKAGGGGGGGDVYTDTTNCFTGVNRFQCHDVAVYKGICLPCNREAKAGSQPVLYRYGEDLYWRCTKLNDTGTSIRRSDNVFTGNNTFAGCTLFSNDVSIDSMADIGSARVRGHLYMGNSSLHSCNGLLYWGSSAVVLDCELAGVAMTNRGNVFTGCNVFNGHTVFNAPVDAGTTSFRDSVSFRSCAYFNSQVSFGARPGFSQGLGIGGGTKAAGALVASGGHLYWGTCRLDTSGVGDVRAAGDNTFTGRNVFDGPVHFDSDGGTAVDVHGNGIMFSDGRPALTSNKLYSYDGDLYWGDCRLRAGDLGSYAKIGGDNVFTGRNTFAGGVDFGSSVHFRDCVDFGSSAAFGGHVRFLKCVDFGSGGSATFGGHARFLKGVDFGSGVHFDGGIVLGCVDGMQSGARLYNYNDNLYWGNTKLGDGDVRAAGNNVFTGINMFNGSVGFSRSSCFSGVALFNAGAIFYVCTSFCGNVYLNDRGYKANDGLYNYNGDLYWDDTKLNSGGDVRSSCNNVFTGENTFSGCTYFGAGAYFCNRSYQVGCSLLYSYNGDLYWGDTKISGGGDVRAAGDNVFTGYNTFNECTGFYGTVGFYGCTGFNGDVTFNRNAYFNGGASFYSNGAVFAGGVLYNYCGNLYWGCERISSPPEVVSTVPSVLRHGRVYRIQVTSGTVDLSGVTVESMATAELYIDYTAGTLVLPAWWWLDGMSSTDGDHDIPPWGQDMEAGHRYVVTVRNDGRKTVANLAYDYPL